MAREFPYPPRMMTRARAAHYCDLSESDFEKEVAAGTLPSPVAILGKRPHWDRKDLDLSLDRMASGVAGDWRGSAKFYKGRDAA